MLTFSDALNAEARVTRSYLGFGIRSEVVALDESDTPVLVEYGQANTFFTCPAKVVTQRGKKGRYGYVTTEELESHEYARVTRFHEVTDPEARKDAMIRYRQSIAF
jgi:hypothetical protein